MDLSTFHPMPQNLSLDSPRIRFNWGFHDATSDKARHHDRRDIPQGRLFCLPAHDPVYSDAYRIGMEQDISAGCPESSEPAWRAYQADKAAKAAERKALKDMRPDPFIRRC